MQQREDDRRLREQQLQIYRMDMEQVEKLKDEQDEKQELLMMMMFVILPGIEWSLQNEIKQIKEIEDRCDNDEDITTTYQVEAEISRHEIEDNPQWQ
eukprot:6270180-Ditylum_brightwellii.AAC.1